MVLPIGLQIRDLDNHWHLRLCRQENMMKGQRRRPAKKTRTGPGVRDGTVYAGKHNASLLEMPDRLPDCAVILEYGLYSVDIPLPRPALAAYRAAVYRLAAFNT